MKIILKYLFLPLLIALLSGNTYAQSRYIDSLRRDVSVANDDTNKAKKLDILSTELYGVGKFDTARICAISEQELSKKLGYKDGIAKANMNIGITYWYQGNYPLALQYYFKVLSLYKELGNKHGIASAYGNIGVIYDEQGDYPKALDNYLKALPLFIEIGSKKGEATDYSGIGVVYKEMGDRKKALEYYNKALKINIELNSKNGIARDFGNIGNVYDDMGDNSKALEFTIKAMNLYRQMGNETGVAINLGNVSGIYRELKNYKLAKAYIDSALSLSASIGAKEIIRNDYRERASLDSTMGNAGQAFEDFKKYILYRDELINEANTKKTVEEQMSFDFQQKQAAIKAEQDKKDALALADKHKQTIIIWSTLSGLILVLFFAGFIFRSLNITRKQKGLIEKQKTEVEQQKQLIEEKNKDILDSITYAKRLQDAILPPLRVVKHYLPDSFLLYKPKDIVAGDFYWIERAGDNILIAAADCTGHGVPGAMVSVVCSNALNRAVKEFQITETGKILDKVRELVLETFSQRDPFGEKSESNVQDGMDISLCCINTRTNDAQWSGAYNSLWYIRNKEVTEVSADKQPIGKVDNPVPFNTHKLNLQKGDMLYLFTDGYADQFGGPKGKKFKYKQLQELLLAGSSKAMDEQKKILENCLNEWKGKLEQVDDILVIGIRV